VTGIFDTGEESGELGVGGEIGFDIGTVGVTHKDSVKVQGESAEIHSLPQVIAFPSNELTKK